MFPGYDRHVASFILRVKQNLIPLYHLEANPLEGNSRNLMVQVAIFVEGDHHRRSDPSDDSFCIEQF